MQSAPAATPIAISNNQRRLCVGSTIDALASRAAAGCTARLPASAGRAAGRGTLCADRRCFCGTDCFGVGRIEGRSPSVALSPFESEGFGAHAFQSFDELERVATAAISVNTGSRRVLEKCGFEFAGLVLEEWDKFEDAVELASYVLTREQWFMHDAQRRD